MKNMKCKNEQIISCEEKTIFSTVVATNVDSASQQC